MTEFISAEWFCVLLTNGACYACQEQTPLAVVWTPRGVEHDDGESYDIDLRYAPTAGCVASRPTVIA